MEADAGMWVLLAISVVCMFFLFKVNMTGDKK